MFVCECEHKNVPNDAQAYTDKAKNYQLNYLHLAKINFQIFYLVNYTILVALFVIVYVQ